MPPASDCLGSAAISNLREASAGTAVKAEKAPIMKPLPTQRNIVNRCRLPPSASRCGSRPSTSAPPANRSGAIESQPIPGTQDVIGPTLRPFLTPLLSAEDGTQDHSRAVTIKITDRATAVKHSLPRKDLDLEYFRTNCR